MGKKSRKKKGAAPSSPPIEPLGPEVQVSSPDVEASSPEVETSSLDGQAVSPLGLSGPASEAAANEPTVEPQSTEPNLIAEPEVELPARTQLRDPTVVPVPVASSASAPDLELAEEEPEDSRPSRATFTSEADDAPPASLADRRTFLAVGAQAVAGLCALGGAATLGRALVSDRDDASTRRVRVGREGDFARGTVTWVSKHDLFVVHDDNGLWALSGRCTHLGCSLQHIPSG